MRKALRVLTRRNIVAAAIGVLLAGAPMVAFDFWLGGVVDQRAQEEVDTSARRAIALAESRVGHVMAALDSLAAAGVGNCSPASLDAMRTAAFDTIPIKEISVVGPDGTALCTHLGVRLGHRDVLATEPLPGATGYTIDVMNLPETGAAVRLSRKVGQGPNSIAALVPAVLFLPQVSGKGQKFAGYAHILTQGGAVIGRYGHPPARRDDTAFSRKATSGTFGFNAEVAMPRGEAAAINFGFERLGLMVTSGMIVALIAFALMAPRRTANNPVSELERALEAGELIPYYQPIVDIRSGQLRGAEVLVRWKKPDGTLVLPGAFIPLAESSGLIRALTHDLMRRVCAEAGAAIGCRPALKISFNFAGQLFGDESVVKEVRNVFSGTPIKLSQVVLEVTERDPIENFTVTRQTIAALQGLGVRIAIDDVGTGHSGLSYMLKLGVDIIKIDKMFVDAIGTDRNSTTIVETLIDLAHNMRMDVVAEGVENFEQVMHLRELGIRSAQGYVFAPPLPGSAFLQLIEAIDPLPAARIEAPASRYVSARTRIDAAA